VICPITLLVLEELLSYWRGKAVTGAGRDAQGPDREGAEPSWLLG